jgi:hypothetical protein
MAAGSAARVAARRAAGQAGAGPGMMVSTAETAQNLR